MEVDTIFPHGNANFKGFRYVFAWHEICKMENIIHSIIGKQGMGVVIESYAFIGLATQTGGPCAQVWLPPGYTLTGGGAYEMGAKRNNVLCASHPIRNRHGVYTGWTVAALDPVPLAVFAIGVKAFEDGKPVEIEQHVFSATSALVPEPGVSVRLPAGWLGTGGGAQDNMAIPANGNLLTASYPMIGPDGKISGWSASGRDPQAGHVARVTAFVIGIRGAEGEVLDVQVASNPSMVTRFSNGPATTRANSERNAYNSYA